MQYSKQDLEESKRAYLKGIKKARKLEKNEEKIDKVEIVVWLLFMLVACVLTFLYGFGEGVAGLIVCFLFPISPAIVFSVTRRIIRAIANNNISRKYKKGALYEKYAVTEITEVYTKATDKIMQIIQQDQNIEKAQELANIFGKDVEKVVDKYQLSPQKEKEVDWDFTKYAHEIERQLPTEQKKIFKNFLQKVKSR